MRTYKQAKRPRIKGSWRVLCIFNQNCSLS